MVLIVPARILAGIVIVLVIGLVLAVVLVMAARARARREEAADINDPNIPEN